MSLAKRSIKSVGWKMLASPIQFVVQISRTVLLARLLPVDTFGVYAWASSLVGFSIVIANFGLGGAFIHRTEETRDENEAAAIHFTLQFIFTLIWAILLSIGAWIFAIGEIRIAILALIVFNYGILLSQTPKLILIRRVVHRRLVLIQTLDIIISSVVAILLAWKGVTLWALLSTNVVSMILNIVLLYVWRPIWRPRFAWSSKIGRYFIRFGSRNVLAQSLLKALDEVDDLWTGIFLGENAMGYYSKAYQFATYPRKILALPINNIAGGTYAELKGDRRRLSQAFFRTNALLVRTGFLFSGFLALIAPEFIRILLSDKWMPMLDAFRLMLIFSMFAPIKNTIASLFIAVGQPQQLVNIRIIQLFVLVVGLFSLGPLLGIMGVALAVNVMVLVGLVIMMWKLKKYVDFSIRKMLLIPLAALIAGLVLAHSLSYVPVIFSSDWHIIIAKTIIFVPVYGSILLLFERKTTLKMINIIIQKLFPDRWNRE